MDPLIHEKYIETGFVETRVGKYTNDWDNIIQVPKLLKAICILHSCDLNFQGPI